MSVESIQQPEESTYSEDRPHELHSDDVPAEVVRQSVRRHIARQVSGRVYPYPLEGTPEERRVAKGLREQTVEAGAEAIKAAERVVDVEHRRIKHLYEASDHPDIKEDLIPDDNDVKEEQR